MTWTSPSASRNATCQAVRRRCAGAAVPLGEPLGPRCLQRRSATCPDTSYRHTSGRTRASSRPIWLPARLRRRAPTPPWSPPWTPRTKRWQPGATGGSCGRGSTRPSGCCPQCWPAYRNRSHLQVTSPGRQRPADDHHRDLRIPRAHSTPRARQRRVLVPAGPAPSALPACIWSRRHRTRPRQS